ncbi:hypothetical protein RhiJN_21865 [Ceratobasidium sp. AG-Ba]|nr:hypothetical protein RhiJN_21865 [Ceratobasidium sp. AG-Ba]
MSSRAPVRRRPTRSDSDTRTSLVLTKGNFLNTLIISKSTRVPVYATITQGEETVLYATDTAMTLQKVAVVSWGQGGLHRKNTTITVGENTRTVGEIFPTEKLFAQLLSIKAPPRRYTCGAFTCTWVEEARHDYLYSAGAYTTCYKPPSSESGRQESSQWHDQRSRSRDAATRLADLEWCEVPGKPRYYIHITDQHLLRQTLGADGLTELDHVVLSALLICAQLPTQRKTRGTPEGWMDEAALQNLLWSSRSPTVPGDVPPLYTTIAGAINQDGLPPAYASRISLV